MQRQPGTYSNGGGGGKWVTTPGGGGGGKWVSYPNANAQKKQAEQEAQRNMSRINKANLKKANSIANPKIKRSKKAQVGIFGKDPNLHAFGYYDNVKRKKNKRKNPVKTITSNPMAQGRR